ncbi:glyoxylate/hydroxypyruvate reductase A [Rhodovarius crocodyli]|uniref:Glyoxylate/hydroxypyruvate reductase A n=1 Tax=Rhodovarius crocodyli TaxID=1979269 RepID=A0A437M407_9PROT|nr:NAD(P)-dependent oxidoreductase [Rhodovarius crocodyli]RVT92305.1 glyoxylate/hydroxypyruvate reductase A [Rhodovarius crocodyli]
MADKRNGIMVLATSEETRRIAASLREMGDYPVWLHGDEAPLEDVSCLVAFRPQAGLMSSLPNLTLVHGTGAGVDGILMAPDLPDVPIGRVIAEEVSKPMTHHVLHAVLRHLRQGEAFAALQRKSEWNRLLTRDYATFPVAVLGTGALGGAVIEALNFLGIPARGWSRSSGTTLEEVLTGAMAVVILLPATPATKGVLGTRELALLADDAAVISVGRGGQVEEEALLAELDAGRLSAYLDVFAKEPLPADSRFWQHPRVVLTPHIAAAPSAPAVARCVLESMERVARGEPPVFAVDRAKGY